MACTKCAAKAKKRRMAKAKMNGIADLNYTKLAGAASGVVIEKKVDEIALNKVEFLAQNPVLKSAVKIAGGLVLASMSGDIVQGIGMGMAASAAAGLISSYLPSPSGGGITGSMYSQNNPKLGSAFLSNPQDLGASPNVYLGTVENQRGDVFSDNYRQPLSAHSVSVGDLEVGM